MTVKIFSYGSLWDTDIQQKEFGTQFHVEDDLDYIKGWDILDIKIYKEDYKIAIPGNSMISGAIVHVQEEYLPKIDKYEGKHYKRINITTETGVECFLYVKNDNKK